MALLNSAKTPFIKKNQIKKQWKIIDATNQVLGRLAVVVANMLRGKNHAQFTPHMDAGDYIVIINASKIKLTGKKLTQKVYYHHTGYPGGMKSKLACEILDSKNPEKLLITAIKGMLPKNALSHTQMKNLKVYAGPDHNHKAQSPVILDFN